MSDEATPAHAEWWQRLFAVIDARDDGAFADLFAEDGEFRFGNGPDLRGRPAIREAVAAFFAAIGGCSHEVLGTWQGSNTRACEGRVTYLRRDGGRVTVPFCNVLDMRGERVGSYRIYVDTTPLWA